MHPISFILFLYSLANPRQVVSDLYRSRTPFFHHQSSLVAVAAVAVVVDALEEGVEHSGPRRGGREAAAAVAVLSPYGEKKSRVTLLVAARL